MEITQELLHELFEYRDGKLYWRIKPNKRESIGQEAGYKTPDGYRKIGYNYKWYGTHRLIFLMFNGFLPKLLDHKNGIRDDNRIENLRPATYSQNNSNCRMRDSNTSGVKNVVWDKDRNKWRVQASIQGKMRNFGRYDDIELAELVAIEVRNKYHGEFANHGKTNEKVST